MTEEAAPIASRRKVLQSLGIGVVGGLAGCQSGPSDSEDLGERVPTVSMGIFSGAAGITSKSEDITSILKQNLEERLGVSAEVKTKEISAWVADVDGDERTFHFPMTGWATTPARLDPEEHTRAYAIDNMGYPNVPHYASCEFSDPAISQSTAPTVERRRELVHEAHSVLSRDVGIIPIAPLVAWGAYRTDLVNVSGLGETGLQSWSQYVYVNSEPQEGDSLEVSSSPELIEDTNYATMTNPTLMPIWTHLIHSPLVEYDNNFELNNVLASNIETADEGRRITVELRDYTFSNGDPITAEDVQYTFQLLWENEDQIPRVSGVPYDSIEVVDEKSVEFNFTESFLPALSVHFPNWGILHKETWEEQGALENPSEFQFPEGNIIGSGPYQVTTLRKGQLLQLEPRDDSHPVHSPSATVNFNLYREAQSAFQALRSGELHIVYDLSTGLVQQANNMDDMEAVPAGGTMPWVANPYFPIAPTKFEAFRKAVAAVIDRQEIVDVIAFGETEPALKNTIFMENHPWRPPDDMLYTQASSATGSEEEARKHLSDAGFGWDDAGNLRYPPDADTSPLWPKKELPSADDFPCIENYN